MSLETYTAFVIVCLIATVVPGPTNMLIVANGMRHGVRAGLLNVVGTLVSLSIMIAVAGIGLTSLIEVAGHWFEWIKLVGAAYLCWLGWKMIRASGEAAEDRPANAAPRRGFFMQGFLVSMGNPKQLLFFGALLPQFIDPAASHAVQIAIMGGTALLFSAVSDGSYAVASGSIGRRLTPRRVRQIARVGGGFLMGGGLWIALSRTR
ncbi:LysE family translocator [Nitratireductor sp. ZSWI3]|uniref:LysE family translocator n=1 Tax=Nitratireductor sp. ZSWI3 TaxID=2966359 RepID=UPI00215033A3|nr:LysE family translocator [Nitratireductor sp. ZSWI3]MCR4267344.1 LysE family translocator [Nitratireductor sp. ZSWI3]